MMNENEQKVYRLLCSWRRIIAEKQYYELRTDLSPEQKDERSDHIGQVLAILEACMRLLTADERYVIKRRLVDEINWSRVLYEYNTKLQRPTKKSLSTLRRMQNKAIIKAARFLEQQNIGWEFVEIKVGTFS